MSMIANLVHQNSLKLCMWPKPRRAELLLTNPSGMGVAPRYSLFTLFYSVFAIYTIQTASEQSGLLGWSVMDNK